LPTVKAPFADNGMAVGCFSDFVIASEIALFACDCWAADFYAILRGLFPDGVLNEMTTNLSEMEGNVKIVLYDSRS
jgi:hypothetical protein